MTLVGLLRKWLVATPLAGKQALLCAVAALAVPTLLRESVDGIVVGIGFTPYSPFVLLSAILLGWRQASVVALASAVLGDALFVGPSYQLIEGPTDVFGVVAFLVTSALIIGLVQAVRTAFEDLVCPTSGGGVIFSLERGQAWASWPTAGFHLRLGPQDEVVEMMTDFIAQVEFGKRLTGKTRPDVGQEISPVWCPNGGKRTFRPD